MTEDVRELFDRARDGFGDRVHQIKDDQWTDRTPCTEWNVRDLVHHLVSELAWMVPLIGGQSVADVGDSLSGDLLGDDPVASWDGLVSDATAVVWEAGAMERTVVLSRRQPSAQDYTYEVLCDLVVHAWDLARAIDADERLDPELVEVAFEKLVPTIEMMRAGGSVGPAVEVPPDADRQTQLLGLLGRTA